MTKQTKLNIVNQTSALFFMVTSFSGSLYRFWHPEPQDTWWKLALLNVIMLLSSFLLVFLGHKYALKKGQIKE